MFGVNHGFLKQNPTEEDEWCCREGNAISWMTSLTREYKLGYRPWSKGFLNPLPKSVKKFCSKIVGGCHSQEHMERALATACDGIQGNYLRGCNLRSKAFFPNQKFQKYDPSRMKGGYWPSPAGHVMAIKGPSPQIVPRSTAKTEPHAQIQHRHCHICDKTKWSWLASPLTCLES